MELFKMLDTASCHIGIKGKRKEDILRTLATMACRSKTLEGIDSALIYQKLMDREAQGSTGFGGEVAIPHARIPGMKKFLLFIASDSKGVEFDTLDKKKVKLFFVILGPEEGVNEHLKILAAISRGISQTNMKKELLAARTEEALAEVFLKNTEDVSDGVQKKQKMKLMYVILYLEDFLYHILEYFIQEGIDGATIIESSGMGEYISNIPLFATFIGFMNEKKNMSKTIMVLIPEDREAEIVKGIEEITGDLNRKEGAMIITTEVSFYKGTMKMM